jgi:ElaA protein
MQNCLWRCMPFNALTLNELYRICTIRQEVFVVEQNCVYLDADGYDLGALHLMGTLQVMGTQQEELVAYARLLPPSAKYPDACSIGRVLTAPDYRGKGFGKALMEQAVAQCAAHFPHTSIRISAQHYLLAFYQDFGFIPCSEIYNEDGIPHIAMKYGN